MLNKSKILSKTEKNKLFVKKYRLKNVSISITFIKLLIGIFIIIASIGYALINEELSITGEATFRVDADIRITDLKFISGSNGAMEEYNSQYSKTSIITGILLPNLDSTITYEVTVTNFGNIAMGLDNIIKENFTNENVEYTLSNISLNQIIPEKSTKVFKITFKYNSNITIVPANQRLESRLEFVFKEYDVIAPVITEIQNMPKTFYITQTENINLLNYVKGVDDVDGDITEKIVITSSPEFNRNEPGIYEIIYNVQDEAGNSATPVKVEIIIWNFTKIDCGGYHTLALTSHGRVWAWGYNNYGQIGNSSNRNASTPVQLDLIDVVDIATNGRSSYAVTGDGKIYSWGEGSDGRLGNGTTTNSNSPGLVTIPDGVKFVKVNAQVGSVASLTGTGEVYTWGYNNVGQLGDGTNTNKTVPIKINLSNIVEISQGGYAGAAIDSNGVLYTWGSDYSYDMLGDLADNGTQNLPSTYSGLEDIKFVQVCHYHVIAISNSGQVYTWGEGSNGKLGNGGTSNSKIPYATSITNGEQASGHWYHSLVKTTDGKLYVFGQNAYGKLGLGDITVRYNPVNNSSPVFVSNDIGNVKYVSAMYDSSIILTEDNLSRNSMIYGMGYNGSYQFGNGLTVNSNVPIAWNFIPPDPE